MAVNIDINDTRTLIDVIERTYAPTTTLVDTFFPQVRTFMTEVVDVEYRKGTRTMAPFVVPGAKGVNMERNGSTIRAYKAPLMRPKRVIEISDVLKRGFGEEVYSRKTPAERAAEQRALDMVELRDMCMRRQEWMAAQLLINGSYEIDGFADDGKTAKIDTIAFEGFEKTILSGSDTWDNADAKIYDDIAAASQTIRRNAGLIPTVAICSANVVDYLLNSEQLYKWLLIPSRDNLTLMSIQPRLQRPDLMRVGFIQSLNLEIYSYDGGYLEDGEFKSYIPDDFFILGIPGRGKRLFGAVTQMEDDRQLHTYATEYVPKVTADIESDTSSLTMSSRCVLCPEFVDDWAAIQVK